VSRLAGIYAFYRTSAYQAIAGAAGYIILVASRNAALSYFAVYLATWCVFDTFETYKYLTFCDSVESTLSYVSYPPVISAKSLNMIISSSSKHYVNMGSCLAFSLLRSDIQYLSFFRAWVSNNVEGSYKRSVSIAMVISLLVCGTSLS
jgi:hypothetical protein